MVETAKWFSKCNCCRHLINMKIEGLDSVCITIYICNDSSKNEMCVALLGDLIALCLNKSSLFVDRNMVYSLCCSKQNIFEIL